MIFEPSGVGVILVPFGLAPVEVQGGYLREIEFHRVGPVPQLLVGGVEDVLLVVIVGVSLQVTAPLGQYDSDRLVNIGTNRWTVKPEIGISKAWRRR